MQVSQLEWCWAAIWLGRKGTKQLLDEKIATLMSEISPITAKRMGRSILQDCVPMLWLDLVIFQQLSKQWRRDQDNRIVMTFMSICQKLQNFNIVSPYTIFNSLSLYMI